MRLSDLLHRVDRPDTKIHDLGPSACKDDELLAVILRTGYIGKNVVELAREVLRRYPGGALRAVPLDELASLKGIGPTRARVIKTAFELADRLGSEPASLVLDSPQKAALAFEGIREAKQEHFRALYLNARHQAIGAPLDLFVGTLSSSLVHSREVFAPAIEKRAAACIVAHNHPSGDPRPSAEDREATRRLRRAGELLGIELLDHLVIATGGLYSFRDQGWP